MKDILTGTNGPVEMPDGSTAATEVQDSESVFGPSPQHCYVYVFGEKCSSAEISDLAPTDCIYDIGENEIVGAAYIGKLTETQLYIHVAREFSKLYKGGYPVVFHPQKILPSELFLLGAEATLSLKVLLGNYKILTDDQKKALEIAVHVANSVRDADGCGSKNITFKASRQLVKDKPPDKKEELEGRRLAAVKYAIQNPETPLASIEKKFKLGQKTLSREPYKGMIGQYANSRNTVPNKGRKGSSYLGKNEKANKSISASTPDTRRSHEDEVDERLDNET